MWGSRSTASLLVAGLLMTGSLLAPAVAVPDGGAPQVTLAAPADSGVVDAVVTGPDGGAVQLLEVDGGVSRAIGSATLSAGRAEVPGLLRWSCTQRRRVVVVRLATGEETRASITTPACAGRLAIAAPRRGVAGRELRVRVRDRWRVGGLRARLCLTPPGGEAQCRRRRTAADQRPWRMDVPVPRPGRWVLQLDARGVRKVVRRVWVKAPAGRRLRLLAGGDSEMQEVDTFMAQALRRSRVKVTSDARVSTGFSNTFFFDWVKHARAVAREERPDVTVMFIGANDGFALPRVAARGRVNCCSRAWSKAYAARVGRAMGSFLRHRRGRVYWFLLPVPRGRTAARYFRGVNEGVRIAAARRPGRVRLIDAPGVFTPNGAFRESMTWQGRSVTVRAPDGYHLSTAGCRIAAQLVVRAMREDGVMR